MEKMTLRTPTMDDLDIIRAYRQSFIDYGGSMDGCGSLRRFDDPADWIRQVEDLSRPETTPPEFVPATQFIYVRGDDGKMVGAIQVRHRFNGFLERYGGHIGYSVCPPERRRGYAEAMLAGVLPYCRTLGLTKVLITCDVKNEASRRTILANGGVYESTVFEPRECADLQRYWIEL